MVNRTALWASLALAMIVLIVPAAQSQDRFTDNGDGTVSDNLTGLIWLQNAGCFAECTWETAVNNASSLASGSCGLSDGSTVGEWRLPSLFELGGLRALQFSTPALSNSRGTGQWAEGDPFSGVEAGAYWSSSTCALSPNEAWKVLFDDGSETSEAKSASNFVWPVRGGQ